MNLTVPQLHEMYHYRKSTRFVIGVVTPVSLDAQGGMQTSALALINQLKKIGHAVIVYSANKQSDDWSVFGGINFISRINLDVLHVHHIAMSGRYAALLKRRFPGTPVVTTVHGLFASDPGYCKLRPSVSEPVRQLLRIVPGKYFERKSVSASDYVIAPSERIYSICNGINADCQIVPNGIDMDMFTPQIPSSQNLQIQILCPGRIFEERGQIYLIKALPEILKSIDCHVTFIGGSDQGYRDQILTTANKLGISKKITILNPIPYADTPRLYSRFDLIAFPTLAESFGMSIVENMALGNVVVASNVENIPNLIQHEENGLLVPPADPEELARAVIRGLTDNPLINKIRSNARNSVMKYDIVNVAKQVERIYHEVVI
jgi:glycosyltransferase involved in cell wall biosynthesis